MTFALHSTAKSATPTITLLTDLFMLPACLCSSRCSCSLNICREEPVFAGKVTCGVRHETRGQCWPSNTVATDPFTDQNRNSNVAAVSSTNVTTIGAPVIAANSTNAVVLTSLKPNLIASMIGPRGISSEIVQLAALCMLLNNCEIGSRVFWPRGTRRW